MTLSFVYTLEAGQRYQRNKQGVRQLLNDMKLSDPMGTPAPIRACPARICGATGLR